MDGLLPTVMLYVMKNWFVMKLALQSDKNCICSFTGVGITLAARILQYTYWSGVAWTDVESSRGLMLVHGGCSCAGVNRGRT